MTEFRGLGETIVDALIAKLQAGWGTRAGLISAEYDDDLTIEAPDLSSYHVGRQTEIALIPACFVLAGPASFVQEGPHGLISVHQINIHVVEQEQTGPRLARKLLRQTRALIECLYDDEPKEQAFVANSETVISAYDLTPLRTIPGAVFQPDARFESWRGSLQTVFTAKQLEI